MINSRLIDKEFPVFLKIKMSVVDVQRVIRYALSQRFKW